MSEPITEAGRALVKEWRGGQPYMLDRVLAIEAEAAALAAAEAAPPHHRIGTDPDCEWCQRFIAATHPYEAGADNVCIHCGIVGSYGHMVAALRSPDTETAEHGSEYGRLLAERDRLIADGADPGELEMPLPPHTETAGEA